MPSAEPIAVVVAAWTGNPHDYLRGLVASIEEHPAGADFDLFVVANGLDYELPPELASSVGEVIVRENVGFNIGAWEEGWRRLTGRTRFLFLQDDCLVKKHGWLRDFVEVFDAAPACGLVSENLIRDWNRPWDELFVPAPKTRSARSVSQEQAARARRYHAQLEAWGIVPGTTARHLTSVVHFTSREVLEAVGGYTVAEEYEAAIAAEIGFSRKVEAAGYELRQVGRHIHSRIGHREWPSGGLVNRLRRSVQKRLGPR